ncbi:MAG TPA: ATP-dependent endonuclease, partial [Candidatus Atribacteria bacterium]|nr:ATP-dependent endonuclease [Candidatus Atribacteria bacterium]
MIFSKCIVLFEGETEEIALPIFFKKYFNKECYEVGVDFIGVGGATKYKTFIKLAELLKILFFIFSDNDRPNEDDIKKKVENQVKNYSSKIPNDVIIFLNSGNNFEEELLKIDGYEDIIKQAILNSIEYKNEQHEQAKYEKDKEKIFNKSKKEILEDMKKNKTKYAFYIAKEIEK